MCVLARSGVPCGVDTLLPSIPVDVRVLGPFTVKNQYNFMNIKLYQY